MTVAELLAALRGLPSDLPVQIWDAGNRMQISLVDLSFIDDENPFVELNTDTDD